MKRMLLVVVLLASASGGGVAADQSEGVQLGGCRFAAYGIGVRLPSGWSARILLGAEGKPVLHAASFPLPSNDDDMGLVAQETIGSRGQTYVNVRDLGPGEADDSLPVAFASSDFGPPPPGPGSRCCFVTVASRDVAVGDDVYRITVTSGSNEPPSDDALAPVNALLSDLSLEEYEPEAAPTTAGERERLAGHGLDLVLPPGWDGRVSDGFFEAASFDLPDGTGTNDPLSLDPDDIVLRVAEHGGSDTPFVSARLPVRLSATEFVPPEAGMRKGAPAVTGRSFVAGGREFVLSVVAGSLPPSSTALAEANAALATLRIEPGDFYPGSVEPATFVPASGWSTGTSGPAEVEPEGEQTITWASTVPYRDAPDQFPPHETLAALPPEGIAIVGWVFRAPGLRSELPAGWPPFRLDEAERASFEGVPDDRATYRILAHVPDRFDVTLWVFFGAPRPSSAQLARAQAELDRLQLPDWPSRP
jgi:hypothetical protein